MSFKNRSSKLAFGLLLLLMVLSGTIFVKPQTAKAILVEDVVNLGVNIKDTVWKLAKSAVEHSASVLFKNTTRYFLNNLAYNAATAIVEGGTGKTPLFPKLQPAELLEQAAGDALGEFIDGVIGEAGLEEFDICNPGSLQTTLNILIPAFREVDPNAFYRESPYKAKCHWQDIKKNWSEFADAARKDPSQYLFGIKAQFKDGANDLDISAKVNSRLLTTQQESKLSAQLNIIANQYINPVVSPISKFIKTPASVVSGSFQSTIDNSTKAETTFTGDLFADALGIFTNTLAAKLQKKIMQGLDNNSMPTSKVTLAQLNNALGGSTIKKGTDAFADFRKVNAVRADGAGMDAFEKFSSEKLPLQGDNSLVKGPGPTSEVLPDFILMAARQELTLKQAIDQGIIPSNLQFGFNKQRRLEERVADNFTDEFIKDDDSNWSNAFSYRGLLIGRTQRLFPQSWELAALYWRYYDNRSTGPLTIQSVMECFADTNTGISPYGTKYSEDPRYPEKCRRDMNGDGDIDDLNPMEDFNPYFHLVDPNWVLRLPATKCVAKGPGTEKVYESTQCIEDNVDAGPQAIPGGQSNGTAISRGEGTPICDADQAKKLGMKNVDQISYDIPKKIVTRDDNYCADWQSCIKEDGAGNCVAYGYCVEEKPIKKLSANSCSFPKNSNNGLYASCDSFQIAGQSYNLVKNTLKKCNDSDAGCKQYSTNMKPNTDGSLSWDLSASNSSLFLNSSATTCDKSSEGCTKFAPYQNGVNLLYNGDFLKTKIGTTIPSGWTIDSEGACDFSQKFNGEGGASLYSDGTLCSVINETPALVSNGYDYLLNFKYKTESDVQISFAIIGYDANGAETKTENISATSSTDWISVSKKISINENSSNDWVFPLNTKGLKVKINHGNQAGKVGFNELALYIVNGPLVDVANTNQEYSNFKTDYTNSNLVSYKFPPKYLRCELYYQKLGNYSEQECKTKGGVWNYKMLMCAVGGRAECDNFTPLCSPQDVGCQLFKSTDGYFDVPAKVSGDDICPNECVNYNSYSRQPSFFEANEFPSLYTTANSCQSAGGNWNSATSACQAQPKYVNLIPSTANQCSASAVGCQSFTNLSASSAGGENKEYFSFLRPCVTETATSTSKVFYTWEGSDTSGYQLKKWTRLVSNLGGGPCTNVDADTGACLDTGTAGVWSLANGSGNRALCTEDDLIDNPDCRDFFDINDNHYFVYQSKTITARQPKSPEACISYRNDLTGKIYNADPSDAVRCSVQEVGCRMFKGGVSNNVRTVAETKFESGTLDGWKNSQQQTNGLTVYNDALRQGEKSLLAFVTNNKISLKKDDSFIEDNKEYTLVVLAKKVTMPAGSQKTYITEVPNVTSFIYNKAYAQSVQEPMVFSYEGNLQAEWREYRIGPITANNLLKNEIQIKMNNLNNMEAFAVDEVRLIEGRDVYYLVDKTWNTPVSCDNVINNLEGCDANGENCGQRRAEGAQLGCQAYIDKNNNNVAIKSFTQLCSPNAVNCQAFINTNNSESPAGFSKVNTCDANVGVVKNDTCLISGIEVCKLNGASSCQYTSAFVPEDNITYFVPDNKHSCDSKFAGCMALGKPGYDLTVQPAIVKKFDTTYLINNPDKYDQILCSAHGLMCELMVASNGSQGVYVSPIGVDEENSRLCIYDSGKERWVQRSNPEINCEIDNPVSLSNRTKYMTTADNTNYRGWVGMCEDSYVGCGEYRNPEQSLTAGANWCDASISPSDYGICDTTKGDASVTVADGKKFCQKRISGIDHLVCELTGGQTKCNYTATDWTCYGEEKFNKGVDENGVCQINGNDVCVIKSNLNGVKDTLSCSYSPLCESMFAISSTVKQCAGGQVDRSSGCAPFYDVNGKQASASAKATKDKGVLVACDENAKPGEENYCNTNVVLENHLSRQCSEWLYCTSSAKVGEKTVCLDVGRCAEADATGKCIKPSIKTNLKIQNQTYDFKNIFDRENVRYSTGYSRTGLSWSPNKAVEGYASPESMRQSSNNSSLVNSDFENIPEQSELKGWEIKGSDNENCPLPLNYSQLLDGKNAWDGHYSLKLSKPGDKGYCELTSNSGTAQGPDKKYYIPINPSRRYTLSYAAKSSNGTQLSIAGMKFYDSQYDECSFVIPASEFNQMPGGKRSKYREIGTYENLTMYYNRFCVDKNGSTNLTQAPSWIWGYSTKAEKIKSEWREYAITFDPASLSLSTEMPANVSFARLVFYAPHSGWGGDVIGSSGDIWLDNIKLDSSLQIAESRYVTSMCRLYPSSDAKQCSYTKLNREYNGWQGYCLEEDPYVPGQCLQWFPVDSVSGDGLLGDDEQVQAYDNRPSLYMCVASGGNYLQSVSTKNSINPNFFTPLCQETLEIRSLNSINSIGGDIGGGSEKINYWDLAYVKLWTGAVNFPGCNDHWVTHSGVNLVPGFWIDNGVKKPAYWFGGGRSESSSTQKFNDGSGDANFTWGEQNWTDWYSKAGQSNCPWGADCNKMGIAVLFENNGSFKDIIFFTQDGSANSGGLTFVDLGFYSKDSCRLIAKVVNDNGENKVAQSTYNRGWRIENGNPMGYTKSTPGSPYGSLVLSESLANKEPNTWGSNNTPFNFETANVGMPLSSIRPVESVSDGSAYCRRTMVGDEGGALKCQGDKTTDPAVMCSYCPGVGRYVYANNVMTSVRCDVDGGENCFSPKELHVPGQTIYEKGIERLKKLFVKVYDWYELVYESGTSVYKKVSGTKTEYYVDESRALGQSGVISGIKVDGNTTGNINIPAPGGSVAVSFKVDIPDEQLPIRKLYIDWGDGTPITQFEGEFNERNSDGNPFIFNHWYGCVPTADGNRCRQCTKVGVVPNAEGACVYDGPKALSKDNWEWCAVAEGQARNNPGNHGNNASCNYVNYDANNANSGKIIVRPRQ